jgi:large repetitive protein
MKLRALLAMVLAVGGLTVANPVPEAAAQAATGSVIGTVYTGFFQPIEGAELFLDGATIAAGLSAIDGSFTIADVAEGTHSITARAAGRVPVTNAVSVVAGQSASAGEFFLETAPVSINGNVFDDAGGAVYPATLELFDEFQSIVATSVTTTTGAYSLTGYFAGSYELRVRDESGVTSAGAIPVTVSGGVDVTGVNFTLVAVATTSLSGVVRGLDSAGLSNVQVAVMNSDFSVYLTRRTNLHGQFAVSDLLPSGIYTATVEALAPYAAGAVDFTVVEGTPSTASLDLALAPGIDGLVTADGGPAVGYNLDFESEFGSLASATTGTDGRYSVSLEPGNYIVHVNSRTTEFAAEFVPDTSRLARQNRRRCRP